MMLQGSEWVNRKQKGMQKGMQKGVKGGGVFMGC